MLSYDSALSGKDKEERSFGKSRKRPERVDTRVTVDRHAAAYAAKISCRKDQVPTHASSQI